MKHVPYKFTKLPNGLSLILQTMPTVNSVALYVAVGAGPRYETRETAGTAHFLEHMLFEGTKTLPSSKEVSEYIEKIGGRSSAWTDKEYVIYYVKIPKQHLERAFNYLEEIIFNSTLSIDAIKKEKRIIMEELKRKVDNPENEISWSWPRSKGENRHRQCLNFGARQRPKQKPSQVRHPRHSHPP